MRSRPLPKPIAGIPWQCIPDARHARALRHLAQAMDAFRAGACCGQPGIVYAVASTTTGPIKIGFTTHSAHRRLSQLQTGSPVELELLIEARACRCVESAAHNALDAQRVRREWYRAELETLNVLLVVKPYEQWA